MCHETLARFSTLYLLFQSATDAVRLQVQTSKSPEKLTSLDDYISRMKPDQKDILYIAGVYACCCTYMHSMQHLLMQRLPIDAQQPLCIVLTTIPPVAFCVCVCVNHGGSHWAAPREVQGGRGMRWRTAPSWRS